MILGIDSSTPPSGGGRRHLLELLNNYDKDKRTFTEIKLWAGKSFLNTIPDFPWLVKFSHPFLDKNLFYRVYWQLFIRGKTFTNKFDILFTPFGTYTGKFKPFVAMSRNMLIFDEVEQRRFYFSFLWIKFKLLYFIQKLSFNKSAGLIFISQYAKDTISKRLKLNPYKLTIINHGVSESFYSHPKLQKDISEYTTEVPFQILFVSSIWVYKHPVNLVKAIKLLIAKGYHIRLNIVGDNAQKKIGNQLKNEIIKHSAFSHCFNWLDNINLNEVNKFYLENDLFVFTSTCENMPNILIEAMASGLPIASSNYNPMPEFLENGAVYFNPLDINDIANCIENIIINKNKRIEIANISFNLAKQYSWQKCTNETFLFLSNILNKSKNV
jgi:glycosyltransferase involved in cell wall biosynthesis